MTGAETLRGLKSPNFSFLASHDALLVKYAAQAEKYLFEDPNTALIKLRQFAEVLAQQASAYSGLYLSQEDSFIDVLDRLGAKSILTPEVLQLFHGLRKAGNQAVHGHGGSQREALYQLRMARTLAVWFHRSFGKAPNYKPGPFVPPPDPAQAEEALKSELERLRGELTEHRHQTAAQHEAYQKEAEAKIKAAYTELNTALELAEETEDKLQAEKQRFQNHIQYLQTQAAAQTTDQSAEVVKQAQAAAQHLDLNEADTRKIIDAQLRDAGWEVDSQALTFKGGTRPQKGKNLAVAEWPTSSGPADYVLFVGLTPLAVVEAKRKAKDVPASIEQAKRYSRDYVIKADEVLPGGPWREYKIPFLFATNGRPYLKQIRTKSGIWFLDGRLPTNHPRPMQGWYSPAGLVGLLGHDIPTAHDKLKAEAPDYLPLREYQLDAIKAIENGLTKGRTEMLLAMATGTGKTRTCIGLVYRLVKAKRFRRVLFLVDRTALGEQASNAFKDVRLENLQTFTDIYDVKELGDIQPDSDTRLHIATIQGMMKRLLYPSDETKPLPVDQYDCIVVDECHRGYNLDKEMSDAELTFRSEQDYISKYSRVLDYFDSVKVGLTATPALHTTEIFGPPIFEYSYRQAVIDGYLVDHEPPIRIVTKLAQNGMGWKKGDDMELYRVKTGKVDLCRVPDDVKIEVEEFNKKVITENFNRVVCQELVKHIDPDLPGKTMVFCATDSHADMVVDMLKEEFTNLYGGIDDDAVVKITGAADKPLEKIRRYKNEQLPSIAVTVDLLTTGIDVPEIVNLVFIRRVRSRILYEQMLGRATRLCPEIGKERFRIFDAVDLYSAIEDFTTMKPVGSPQISFVQLIAELSQVEDEAAKQEVFDQLVAKLQRRKRSLKGKDLEDLTTLARMQPEELIKHIRKAGIAGTITWFGSHAGVAEILDRQNEGPGASLIISKHDDELVEVGRGYGDAKKPEDYLEGFRTFLRDNMNLIPALKIVTTKPRELTRQQLKELRLALDKAGYSEAKLRVAWHEMTNEDIAASIIGFIRQMALGSPLMSYEERVRLAMKKILASQPWTTPQRKWLERIGKQLLAETIVDHDALDRGEFKAQGGFARLNKVFEGKLDQVLSDLNEALWQDAAS
ncbi:type I restriction-modification system deoxyribonuclease [Desulfuromonas versatilis]|uniref:Type I restriction-modification system deoxyribonuclease n=1 Tax=Desulfuromonas versatilis TaxID=2802975 RepID=A0ABM8HX74_9BACT|nr:type I restriction-modification system endonuclease [Desulfuromonas versatilis]BCR05317.1 type I restriction-modification system deoxyribonuclease [Desulfuromonas versatilis]